MAIRDLYFKRRMRERGEVPTVLQQQDIPGPLREQILYILTDLMKPSGNLKKVVYDTVFDILARELGRTHLGVDGPPELQIQHIFRLGNVDHVLSAVELMFSQIAATAESMLRTALTSAVRIGEIQQAIPLAIKELNERFLWHGVGFQIENGQIMPADSRFLHAEVVKPALVLLSEPRFAAAADEFMKAYEHYRHGNLEEALTEACKCFESTLKVICDGRAWAYPPTATARVLIDMILANGLFPAWMQAHFTGLRQILETGVPTPRNKMSGHGDGSAAVVVPPYFVPYVLHLTASNILVLVEADRAMPR